MLHQLETGTLSDTVPPSGKRDGLSRRLLQAETDEKDKTEPLETEPEESEPQIGGAPEGLCAKQTDSLDSEQCAQKVKNGACDDPVGLQQCAKSCCDAGEWTGLIGGPDQTKRIGYPNAAWVKAEASLTAPPVTVSAEEFKKTLDQKMLTAFNEAKNEVQGVTNQLQKVRGAAMKHVKRVADAYAKHMPKLKSVTVDRIYLQCMYRPELCDATLIKEPDIRVCFTVLGCLSSKTSKLKPTIATLQKWIENEAQRLTLEWFESMLEYKEAHIRMPFGVVYVLQSVTIKGQGPAKDMTMLTGGIASKPRSIRVPVGVDEEALAAFERDAVAEAGAEVDTDHILPEPFTESGEEREALKDLKDDGAAVTMGAGVIGRMPADMDKDANANIVNSVQSARAPAGDDPTYNPEFKDGTFERDNMNEPAPLHSDEISGEEERAFNQPPPAELQDRLAKKAADKIAAADKKAAMAPPASSAPLPDKPPLANEPASSSQEAEATSVQPPAGVGDILLQEDDWSSDAPAASTALDADRDKTTWSHSFVKLFNTVSDEDDIVLE